MRNKTGIRRQKRRQEIVDKNVNRLVCVWQDYPVVDRIINVLSRYYEKKLFIFQYYIEDTIL